MRIARSFGALSTALLVLVAGCGDDEVSGSTGPEEEVADASGTWTFESTIEADSDDENDQPCSLSGVTLVLQPGGESLASGGLHTCGGSTPSPVVGEFDVHDLVVDGDRVEFVLTGFLHEGTVTGDVMGGSISGEVEGLTIFGDWSAVRQ